MSTVALSEVSDRPPDEPDPYRYGWRFVPVEGPDGTESLEQVPLTLEDVLFPETGDFIVQTDLHDEDSNYLKNVFKSRLVRNPRTAVVSDCRVDWNLPGVRPLGPDIAVFFDVEHRRDWATLDVVAEGVTPKLVVEVTSPSTRKNDVEDKFDFYHRARVPFYVIADVLHENNQERHVSLFGYRYTRAGYQKLQPDARGWIWLEPVQLWLGVTRDRATGCERLACYDPVSGEEVGDYTALSEALSAEKKAREQAEARVALAMEASEQAEQRTAAAERNAAAEAEARERAERLAAAEAEARIQAEARIRELEAAMRQIARDP